MPTMFCHLYVPDCDTVYQRALQAGATSIAEPVDHPYGDRSGGVKDAFGNQWYIATHILYDGLFEFARNVRATADSSLRSV